MKTYLSSRIRTRNLNTESLHQRPLGHAERWWRYLNILHDYGILIKSICHNICVKFIMVRYVVCIPDKIWICFTNLGITCLLNIALTHQFDQIYLINTLPTVGYIHMSWSRNTITCQPGRIVWGASFRCEKLLNKIPLDIFFIIKFPLTSVH